MQNEKRIEEILDKLLLEIKKDSERDLPSLAGIGEKLNFISTYTLYNNKFCNPNFFVLQQELYNLIYQDQFVIPFKSVKTKKFDLGKVFNINTDLLWVVKPSSFRFDGWDNKLNLRFGVKVWQEIERGDLASTDMETLKYVYSLSVGNDLPDINQLKQKLNKYKIDNAIILINQNLINNKKLLKIIKILLKKSKIKAKIIKFN